MTEIYKTESGRVLTDEDFEKLADEAERGYDIERLFPRLTDETTWQEWALYLMQEDVRRQVEHGDKMRRRLPIRVDLTPELLAQRTALHEACDGLLARKRALMDEAAAALPTQKSPTR